MPVHNSNLLWLDEASRSLSIQNYKNWELCICDNGSKQPELISLIESHQANGLPIKLVVLPTGAHISMASNKAISLATGEVVCFLEHDDLIDPIALLLVAWKINQVGNEFDFIFTNEDKIDAKDCLFFPTDKGIWDRKRLGAINYCCHLLAVKTALVRELGGLREGTKLRKTGICFSEFANIDLEALRSSLFLGSPTTGGKALFRH